MPETDSIDTASVCAEPNQQPRPTARCTQQPPLPLLVQSMLILLLVGASLGSFCFACAHFTELPALLGKNTMPIAARRWMLLGIGAGGAATCTCAIIYLLWQRSASAVQRIFAWSLTLCPLTLAFILPILLNTRSFHGRTWHFTLVTAVFGIALERLLRISLTALAELRSGAAGSKSVRPKPIWLEHLPTAFAIGLALFFSAYFSWFTIINHLRLQTASWDLAIFDNMMWNLIRGEWFKASPDLGRTGSHIQYHATFAAYFLAPFYALRQQADTLLIIQGVLLGTTCIPVYLLAKARVGSAWVALVLALAFGLHAPLHGPLFYDFHFLTIAPFFITWVLYFYETQKLRWLIVTWFAALMVREDQSACIAAAALFFLLSNKKPWWALTGGILSALYFLIIKFGIMPMHRSSADKQTFAWIFSGLIAEGTSGFGGVIQTLLSNPIFVLESMLEEEKLSYVLQMFGPVLLLPLRSARTWLLFVPAIIFTLFSTGYKPLYQTYFQYTANWTPYLFFGTAVALSHLKKLPGGMLRVQASTIALLITVIIFSFNQGAVIGRDDFRGGFRKVSFERSANDHKRYADLQTLIAEIPPDASVAATETEAPHVSNREDCFTMRFGHDNADFLLISIAEGKTGKTKTHLLDAINSGNYGLMQKRGDFMLWGRGAAQSRNAYGKRLIGAR